VSGRERDMRVPLGITFRGVEKSEGIESLIREKASKLDKLTDSLISCQVAVEKPQKHQRTGNPFRVRINLRVPPGNEIVVKRESSGGDLHDGLTKVIREAFDAAHRNLQDFLEKRRGEVKAHPQQEAMAFVSKVFREEGYGFILSVDGREFYFHKNSVLNDGFDRLRIGTGVRFVETAGEEGPQASTVQIVDKPGSTIDESEEPAGGLPV
jgi:cold shock CspA family protein